MGFGPPICERREGAGFVGNPVSGRMQSITIRHRVDRIGRVEIPHAFLRMLRIVGQDALEFYVDGETIVLCKYEPPCIFCGDTKGVSPYRGQTICSHCRTELAQIARGGTDPRQSDQKPPPQRRNMMGRTSSEICIDTDATLA